MTLDQDRDPWTWDQSLLLMACEIWANVGSSGGPVTRPLKQGDGIEVCRFPSTSPSIWPCGNHPAVNSHLSLLLCISLLMKVNLDLYHKRSFWFYCSSSMTPSSWMALATPRRFHFQTMHLNLVRPWDTTLRKSSLTLRGPRGILSSGLSWGPWTY